jgi:muramoyltetrapeptide carboxypeptidase
VAIIPEPIVRDESNFATLSPAGPVSSEEVDRGISVLNELGYSAIKMPHALDRIDYLAGSDEDRATDINDAFADPEIDAIICTRGGYGSMRLLDLLDYDLISENPKPFIGFSDITVIQNVLYEKCGLVTFSGPQLSRGGLTTLDSADSKPSRIFSTQFWLDMLEGNLWLKSLPLPDDHQGLISVRSGRVEAPLMGGNLAVLAAIAGSKHFPDFSGSIMILEEIDEPPYRLDRMLTQLFISGAFEGVKGIVLGRFYQKVQGEIVEHEDVVSEIISSFIPDVPIMKNAPYGHIGPCWTLPIGATIVLDSEKNSIELKGI